MGEWRSSSIVLDLGTSWRWVASFRLGPLYPQRKNTLRPLDRRLGVLPSRSGRYREEKNLTPAGNRIPLIQIGARTYTEKNSSIKGAQRNWFIISHSIIHQWLYNPLMGPGLFFSFVIFYTDGRTPWTGDQPIARLPPTHRTAQTQNKRTQISMPWVGFEPTIAEYERAKTVHALHSSAAVIGGLLYISLCKVHLDEGTEWRFRMLCLCIHF
jgi:hypothetical protein